jgi:hypothetical protein
MALQRSTPIPLYGSCETAMKFVGKVHIASGDYGRRLKRESEVIIEKMMDMVMNPGYLKPQLDINTDPSYMKDAAKVLAKFIEGLEPVFTRDTSRKKKPLATADARIPKFTKDWSENEIKTLYHDCQSAVKIFESKPAITSENYMQLLQTGRDAIIESMMKVIMDANYFQMKCRRIGYLLDPQYAPEVLAMFLVHLETVFTEDEEVRLAPKEQRAMPAAPILVALVEAPDPRRKSGILRSYGEMNFSSANIEVQLEFLQGKKLLNENLSDEGETYNLTGERKVILCMHLWSLMRYAGVSEPGKIWEGISKGWPECVSWKKGYYGHFWEVIYSEEVPLRLQTEIKGLKTILDAYKDMERYFNLEGDKQHCLINWPSAYYPTEDNPNPTIDLWESILTELTNTS